MKTSKKIGKSKAQAKIPKKKGFSNYELNKVKPFTGPNKKGKTNGESKKFPKRRKLNSDMKHVMRRQSTIKHMNIEQLPPKCLDSTLKGSSVSLKLFQIEI